jgi:hypothetical protein
LNDETYWVLRGKHKLCSGAFNLVQVCLTTSFSIVVTSFRYGASLIVVSVL